MKRLKMKEPVNTWTHFITCIAAIVGLVYLITQSYEHIPTLISVMIYGVSIIMLFAASSLYHWIHTTPKKELLLKKIDHCAIYIMIAGSYTPVFYVGLNGVWKWIMLSTVWILASIGIILKIKFIHTARYVYTTFYLALGWIAVIPFFQLIDSLPLSAIYLMFIGGLLYSTGAVIYATKWLNFFPDKFGFHEVFHLFIMGGSAVHFLMMILYIVPLGIEQIK